MQSSTGNGYVGILEYYKVRPNERCLNGAYRTAFPLAIAFEFVLRKAFFCATPGEKKAGVVMGWLDDPSVMP